MSNLTRFFQALSTRLLEATLFIYRWESPLAAFGVAALSVLVVDLLYFFLFDPRDLFAIYTTGVLITCAAAALILTGLALIYIGGKWFWGRSVG